MPESPDPPGGPTEGGKNVSDDVKATLARAKARELLNDELSKEFKLLKEQSAEIDRLIERKEHLAKLEEDHGHRLNDMVKLNKELGDAISERNDINITTDDDEKQRILEKVQRLKDLKGLNAEQAVQDKKIAAKRKEMSDKFGIDQEKAKKKLKEVETGVKDFGSVLEETFAGSRGIIGTTINDAARLKKGLGAMAQNMANFASGLQSKGKILSTLGTGLGFIAEGVTMFAAATVGSLIPVAALVIALFKLWGMAVKFDNAAKKLAAGGGSVHVLNEQLREMYSANLTAGISMEENAAAMGTLRDGFSGFSYESKEANMHMATTIARLEKLGVGGAESAKTMDYFHRVMGKGKEASADLTVELAMMGRTMGKTSAQMMADFAKVSDSLAVFGDRAIPVFQDLAAQAKASGMEIGSLVKMAEGFNTFDKAADSVAQMNAVLGTQMSTIDVMNMEYDDRINYIRQEVQMSVGNFDNLDMYTKQYVAQAMGVGSVAEAQKMLNMTQSEYLDNLDKQKAAAKSQEEMAEITKELVPVWEKLKIAFLKVILVMSPILEGFTVLLYVMEFFIDGFFWAYDGLVKILGPLGPVVNWFLKMAATVAMVVAGLALVIEPSTKVALVIFGIVAALQGLYHWFHKPGSPELWEMPKYFAMGFDMLGEALLFPITLLEKMIGKLLRLWATFKKGAGFFSKILGLSTETDTKAADAKTGIVEALSKMNTDKMATNIQSVKSALMELALVSASMDGVLAIKTDGSSTSLVMGSGDAISSFSEGKLTVDVNIPKVSAPNVTVQVYIDGSQIEAAVAKVISEAG